MLDARLAEQLRPLLDQRLLSVSYDLTTLRAEGTSKEEDDFQQFGISKDGGIHRQSLLRVVQTAEGLPFYHEVLIGSKYDVIDLTSPLNFASLYGRLKGGTTFSVAIISATILSAVSISEF